jgi:hypothetical protein
MSNANDVVPASPDSSPEPERNKARFPRLPATAVMPVAILVTVVSCIIILLVFAGGAGSNANGHTSAAQGFGVCDNGGRADETGIVVPIDGRTLASSIKEWAPEVDLIASPEKYDAIGRVQLDGCAIYALVDYTTGEYYGFALKFDTQGAYIIGVSRVSMQDIEDIDSFPDKVLVRPRQ